MSIQKVICLMLSVASFTTSHVFASIDANESLNPESPGLVKKDIKDNKKKSSRLRNIVSHAIAGELSDQTIVGNGEVNFSPSTTLTAVLNLPSVNEARATLTKDIIVEPLKSEIEASENSSLNLQSDIIALNIEKAKLVLNIHSIFEKSDYSMKYTEFLLSQSIVEDNISSIRLAPFKQEPDPSLNIAYSILMDNFLNMTGIAEINERDKTERLSVLTSEFQQLIATQEKLIQDNQSVRDKSLFESVQLNCDANIKSAQNEINYLRKYFKQMLFHTGITYDYITKSRKAILDNENLLQTSASDNIPFPNVKEALDKTSENAKSSILYLKRNIRIIETLMHSLYPYVRQHTWGVAGQFANTLWNLNWKSEARLLRAEITGEESMPSLLTFSMVEDKDELAQATYQDLIKSFSTTVKQMLVDSCALQDALTNQRIVVLINTSEEKN